MSFVKTNIDVKKLTARVRVSKSAMQEIGDEMVRRVVGRTRTGKMASGKAFPKVTAKWARRRELHPGGSPFQPTGKKSAPSHTGDLLDSIHAIVDTARQKIFPKVTPKWARRRELHPGGSPLQPTGTKSALSYTGDLLDSVHAVVDTARQKTFIRVSKSQEKKADGLAKGGRPFLERSLKDVKVLTTLVSRAINKQLRRLRR